MELENVAPALLLPPAAKGGGLTAALAGGAFDLGDRVAAVGGGGVPPFGARGTVVGVMEDAVEVRGFHFAIYLFILIEGGWQGRMQPEPYL